MDEEFDNITFHSTNELLGFLKQSYFANQSTIHALREDKARLERLLTQRAADKAHCSQFYHAGLIDLKVKTCPACGETLCR